MSKKLIFLDNNSTTKIDPRVASHAKQLLNTFRANTMSSHVAGCEARDQLEICRGTVADLIHCDPSELVFCSGATEANNIVLGGFILKHLANHHTPTILCSNVEHVSVLNVFRYWNSHKKLKVLEVGVDNKGRIKIPEYIRMLKNNKIDLVSILHVNNEVGTVQDIELLSKLAHKHGAFFHSDCTQSIGKIPVHVKEWKLDSVTWSAHKLYSVGGCGAVVLSHKLQPHVQHIMFGNDNEHKFRPGTCDLFSIDCMSFAMKLCNAEMKKNYTYLVELTEYLLRLLKDHKIAHRVNSGGIFSLNVSFYNSKLTSDQLIALLSKKGICVSKSSACKSRYQGESYVLHAMGLEEISPTLRIGIGKFNTRKDIRMLVHALDEILNK